MRDYHPGYYAAFLIDPDGNNIEAVFHGERDVARHRSRSISDRMVSSRALGWLILTMIGGAAPAWADQVWIGLYEHDITLAQKKFENGQDIKAGWIGERIDGLRALGRPAPHVIASKSLNGETNYLAAGLNWTFGSRVYARPGIGLAVNDGPPRAYRDGKRVDRGSPITFEPEIAFGWRISDRIAIEASWIHLSHATLFSRQNRGMDSWGVRALFRLR